MVGLFVIHPRVAHEPRVDRDFALLIQEWAILPGSTIPNTMSMEFNLFSINGRAAPYVTPLVCKLGERVRIRLVNFGAIDHHPMHLHGVTFFVTATEGGRIQASARVPGNTVLVAVAGVRRYGLGPRHAHGLNDLLGLAVERLPRPLTVVRHLGDVAVSAAEDGEGAGDALGIVGMGTHSVEASRGHRPTIAHVPTGTVHRLPHEKARHEKVPGEIGDEMCGKTPLSRIERVLNRN